MMFLTLLLYPPQIVLQDNPNLQQFPFTKQKQLLVPIPGEGNQNDFYRLLLDDTFLNLLVRLGLKLKVG